MNEGRKSNSRSAECFFDYQIVRDANYHIVRDANNKKQEEIKPPKVYMERSYKTGELSYETFFVPQEWLGRSKKESSDIDESNLPYDSIKLEFDVAGTDPKDMKNPEIGANQQPKAASSIDAFYGNGCMIPIANSATHKSLDGVGTITMLNGKNEVAKFYLSINFAFKRDIFYDICYNDSTSKLSIKFECEQEPVGIKVKVVSNEEHLPCVLSEMSSVVEEFTLEFNQKKFKWDYDGGKQFGPNVKFSVTMASQSDYYSDYYILQCRRNDTVKINNPKVKYHPVVYRCPYCHSAIDNRTASNLRYKKGGISCSHYENNSDKLIVYDEKEKKLQNTIYCAEDTSSGDSFDSGYNRLLPDNFMAFDSYKIALLGSARAGKTTFISRFFHVYADKSNGFPDMDMLFIKNGISKLGMKLEAPGIPKVEPTRNSSGETKWKRQPDCWDKDQFNTYYASRRLSIVPSCSLEATTTNTGSNKNRPPFITKVNNSAYISFYDVAGEDSQKKNTLDTLVGGDEDGYLGVFCIVSGNANSTGAASVFSQLKNAHIHKDSPIAVIVTKFDTLDDEFDPNCYCRRTDYYGNNETGYAGSYLQRAIDYSSEEIASYLKSARLYDDLGKFTNVKFFGVSSFNFNNSMENESDMNAENKKMLFECSPSRMELPFIWMLNQFGIIK